MRWIVAISVLVVFASCAVGEEELTLSEKKVENAMHAIFGEDPPHDIPLDYENPSLHDKLVSKQRKEKKEREKKKEEEEAKLKDHDHSSHADHSEHDHSAHADHDHHDDHGTPASSEKHDHTAHESHNHGAHKGHNHEDAPAKFEKHDHKAHGNHNHGAHEGHSGHNHSAHESHASQSSHDGQDHSAHAHHAHHGHHGAQLHSAHGSHGGHDHGGHQMMMWFHGGYNEVILFDFWRINSLSGLIFSCVIIFIMGALYEGLKWFRVYLTVTMKPKAHESLPVVATECSGRPAREIGANSADVPLVNANSRSTTPEVTHPGPFSPSRLIQAFLYIIQLIVAYWLMLIAMTYNTWLTAAVVLGAGFGHWIFAALHLVGSGGEGAESLANDACH